MINLIAIISFIVALIDADTVYQAGIACGLILITCRGFGNE